MTAKEIAEVVNMVSQFPKGEKRTQVINLIKGVLAAPPEKRKQIAEIFEVWNTMTAEEQDAALSRLESELLNK